jgi:hypothetical protein
MKMAKLREEARTRDDDDEIVSDSVNGFVVSTPEIVFSPLQKIHYRDVSFVCMCVM